VRSASDNLEGSLPPPPRPAGSYRPAVAAHGVVRSAGMIPRVDGVLTVTGRLGEDIDVPAAREAAGLSVRNALAAISAEVGGLGHIDAVLQLRVFVRCTAEFTDVSAVAEGASQALADALGEVRGCGVRTAVGVTSLPGGSPVEVELVASYTAVAPA
jgi:enamine deaminase RidA (YjgF/YER057c/UK114 family)